MRIQGNEFRDEINGSIESKKEKICCSEQSLVDDFRKDISRMNGLYLCEVGAWILADDTKALLTDMFQQRKKERTLRLSKNFKGEPALRRKGVSCY